MNFSKLARPLLLLCAGLLAVIVWQARLLQALRRESAAVRAQASLPSAPPASGAGATTRASSSGSASADEFHAAPTRVAVPPIAPVATNRTTFDWRQVESEDYRTYVKNLRAIGCPEQTIRDIVSADVRQAFAAQRAEVMAERFRDFKYWKADAGEAAARTALEPRQREVDEAMRAAVRELLGGDEAALPTQAEWQQAAWSQQLGFLPLDKREQTQALLLQYAEVDAQIKELAWGHLSPESPAERLRVVESYARKREALNSLLTPEEYELVDLTTSWTANNLRRAMTKFQPTEEEFRAIFRAWRAQDEQLAAIFAKGQPDPGTAPVFARIANGLTPERYEKYRATWWQ